MATFDTLVAATERLLLLPGTKQALQLNSPTRERAFEAYVFALVLRAVRAAGGTVGVTGINSGPNPDVIVFRGAPGQMSSQIQDFAYARCTLNLKSFEVHVAVQFLGTSEATHEVDVSLFDSRQANVARQTGAVPGMSALRR